MLIHATDMLSFMTQKLWYPLSIKLVLWDIFPKLVSIRAVGHQYFQKIAFVATHSVLCIGFFLALFDTGVTSNYVQQRQLYIKEAVCRALKQETCQVCSQAMIPLRCVWPGMSDAGCLPVCYARLCFAELCGMSDGGFELLYNIVDPKLEHGVPTIREYS